MGAPELVWVCAVCGRVLDEYRGKGFEHTLTDAKVADHPVVAVQVPPAMANLRCDICHDDTSAYNAWTLTVEEFMWLGNNMGSDWLLNPPCAALVQADDWDGLLRRGIDGWERRHGSADETTKIMLQNMYAELRRQYKSLTPPPPMPEEGS